jgi:hypothetical protein
VEVRSLALMIGELHMKAWLKYSFYFFRKEISRFLVCVCCFYGYACLLFGRDIATLDDKNSSGALSEDVAVL